MSKRNAKLSPDVRVDQELMEMEDSDEFLSQNYFVTKMKLYLRRPAGLSFQT
jgi:hypothetical protein